MSCQPSEDGKSLATNQYASMQLWSEQDKQFIVDELNTTTQQVLDEVKDLTQEQWNFKETSESWSIGYIVEHLEMQNQLQLSQYRGSQ